MSPYNPTLLNQRTAELACEAAVELMPTIRVFQRCYAWYPDHGGCRSVNNLLRLPAKELGKHFQQEIRAQSKRQQTIYCCHGPQKAPLSGKRNIAVPKCRAGNECEAGRVFERLDGGGNFEFRRPDPHLYGMAR